ncbi:MULTISPECIES: hypothetical protein [Cyanophyceae]|nr:MULTISPECIES: hypothetical protein [Cyanophyceae]MBD1914709.1 hypothetical protein [Phormidium sp. FACHB-77]MBD2032201.1 hypothetical protein [Phormidium sp. FACHB-322]MBD2049204.1 hypothetical protein [Leptolyngbya sp. FACHB-60]
MDTRSLTRRQLYVAMTKAQDELHLVAEGTGMVSQALEKADAIETVKSGN